MPSLAVVGGRDVMLDSYQTQQRLEETVLLSIPVPDPGHDQRTRRPAELAATHYGTARADLLAAPVDWADPAAGTLSGLRYATAFGLLAWQPLRDQGHHELTARGKARARSPLRCVRRHELSPNAPERRSPPCDELSSAPRGPTRGARHRLPGRPQARAVIAGGRPAGDHEEPLAVVGLDLEHDAGAGVVHRADVPLGEQDASAPPGAAPQPDSGSTSCASAASPRRHTVARSPPPDGYR